VKDPHNNKKQKKETKQKQNPNKAERKQQTDKEILRLAHVGLARGTPWMSAIQDAR